ncbi:hypothetical protein I350_01259 [Cryptococcus amylolentus CBS 6273]|nr:hypothetical protein I350_01259 [Cryptococcus amylolentus CBS 6273]
MSSITQPINFPARPSFSSFSSPSSPSSSPSRSNSYDLSTSPRASTSPASHPCPHMSQLVQSLKQAWGTKQDSRQEKRWGI